MCWLQDIFKLSSVLTGNLHQLHESVKQLASKVLSAATDAASKQLLPECAGGWWRWVAVGLLLRERKRESIFAVVVAWETCC